LALGSRVDLHVNLRRISRACFAIVLIEKNATAHATVRTVQRLRAAEVFVENGEVHVSSDAAQPAFGTLVSKQQVAMTWPRTTNSMTEHAIIDFWVKGIPKNHHQMGNGVGLAKRLKRGEKRERSFRMTSKIVGQNFFHLSRYLAEK